MSHGKFINYQEYVEQQAVEFVDSYFDEALEEIKNGDTNMDEFIDGGSRLFEWCDNEFIYVDLVDSAHILEQSDNVETDSGLWEGLEPRKAIEAQAYYTFRTDLFIEVRNVFNERLGEEAEKLEEKWEELDEELNAIPSDSDDYDDVKEEIDTELDEIRSFIDNINDAIDTL